MQVPGWAVMALGAISVVAVIARLLLDLAAELTERIAKVITAARAVKAAWRAPADSRRDPVQPPEQSNRGHQPGDGRPAPSQQTPSRSARSGSRTTS